MTHLPDRDDWQSVHHLVLCRRGLSVSPLLQPQYDRAADAGLCARVSGPDAYGNVSFVITAFGLAWLRLYNAKAFGDPSPTAGEVAALKEALRVR